MADDRSPALLIVDVQNDFCSGARWPCGRATRSWPRCGGWPNASRPGLPCLRLARLASARQHALHDRRRQLAGALRAAHARRAAAPGSAAATVRHGGHHGSRERRRRVLGVLGTVAGRGSLADDLRARGVNHLYVGGLATDYCVKHSVLDALRRGIGVTVLTDAVRAVDVQPGDGAARARGDAGRRSATGALGGGVTGGLTRAVRGFGRRASGCGLRATGWGRIARSRGRRDQARSRRPAARSPEGPTRRP
jgi:nicotinamidase/pyrazinamidase